MVRQSPPTVGGLAHERPEPGAGIAWTFGEIPTAVLMLVLFRQWVLADERE
jgi:cytochrome c oxidase assembly factor CtaG